MAIYEINENDFEENVINYKGKVLVDFNADWCGPCQMLKPLVEDIANNRSDIKVVSVNIDNNEDLAGKYNIMSIPCLILFYNGKEINRSVGYINKGEIERFIGEDDV